MIGRSLIAIAVSLAMMTVVFSVVDTASSEIIASEHCLGGYGNDRANAIEIDSSGNVYLAGEYVDVLSNSDRGFIAKFAADGSLAWDLGLQYQSLWTSVTDVALDADGNAYVLFFAPVSILAKVTSSGTVTFAKELTGLGTATRVASNPANGGAIVIGDEFDYGQSVVASFSSTGTELWSKVIAGSSWASPWGATVDSSGNVYVVMDRMGDDVGVIEFSSQGDIVRQVILSTSSPEYSWDITMDSAGNVYVLGLEFGGMHAIVAKLTSTLESIWAEYLVSDTFWQECLRLAVASDGSVYAIGQGTAPTANYSGALCFHLSSDGALLGSSIYDGRGESMLYFSDAAVSSTGTIVFAGLCYGPPVMVPTPIPDETAVPVTGSWVPDNTAWLTYSMGAISTTLDLCVPDVVVDNYDISYGNQAWFGTIGVPELSVSIDYRILGKDGSSFEFRGSVTGGQKPYSFSWDFGDGTSGTGKKLTHAYAAPGQFAVALMVFDSQGKFGYATVVVSVLGPPVISYVSTSYPAYINTITSFYADAYDPDGGAITSYAWDFGDGTSTVVNVTWVDHVYTAAGSYLVDLTVTDDEGDTANYQTMLEVLSKPNVPPVAMFTLYPTPVVGKPVTFNGSLSYDPDGYIASYSWVFGDGFSATGPIVTHTYSAAGMYIASLTVTDNLNSSAYAIRNVTVYQQVPTKDWTFLVYLDADNDLEDVGSIDFMEMSAIGSDANINIVVEMDRNPYWDMSYGDWTTTKRFYVTHWMTPDGYNALEDLGEMNMGDPQTLLNFIVWGVTTYPADNCALVLWDHGGGWDGAVCWDDTNYGDALTLDEVESALAGANSATGARVNLLAFDACLMGMVEVAYEVIEHVDVIAFSEEVVPWDGFPYDMILWDLKGNSSMSATELGDVIVSRYMQSYINESMGDPSVTMSSMDVLSSGPLYLAIEQFSTELLMAVPTEQAEIIGWMYSTEYFYFSDYIDLYDFARIVSENTSIESLRTAALAVMSAVNAVLTSEGHGYMHPNAHGLSIYFPLGNSSYLEYYANSLDFTRTFSWDEFLIALLSAKDDQYEPDNQYTQSTPIAHGETQIHSISNGGSDVDWLVFEVTQNGSEVRVNTSGLPGVWTDTVLLLFNAYGVPYTPIASDDDSGYNGCSMIQMFLPQGIYYVEVTSYYMAMDIPWYGVSVYIGDIPNFPPYAGIYYWPYDPGVGTQISFNALAYDPDGYIVDITWDFGDGTIVPGWQNYTLHAYAAPGDYTVVLTVTDDDGASASASIIVHVVMNIVPVVAMTYYPPLPDPYDTVYFDASMSYDPDGYIDYYYWDFGDGYTAYTGNNYAYHYYHQGGLYLVTLTVTDNRGATNSTSAWIHVNMPPVAVIVPSVDTGKVGSPVTFDGSGSYDPEGSPIVYYDWYFSDGGNETGPIVVHTFYEVGYYEVYLQVSEANGSWGSTVMSFVVVTAVPPAAIIAYSPSYPFVGQEVQFDGLSSVDPDGSIVTYIWQLGDGTVATGDQVAHVYLAPGSYEIQLTVIDEDKLIDKSVTKIMVKSQPVAAFEYSPAAPSAGQVTTFYAVGSYDPMGITQYVWSFGDGTYAEGWQASHTFATKDSYVVSLTVTNAAGIQMTISKTVSVSAKATAPDVNSMSGLDWDEPPEIGTELLLLVLGAISIAVGCVVGDVAVNLAQRRKKI